MIYIVTGWMRSGTSMLMQALEAGGMPVVKSAERDAFNAAHSDETYRPNHAGLYEADRHEMAQPGWPRQHDGRAIKVVVPHLKHLAVHEWGYRVVFMRRDLEEIRQSYEAAFGERLSVDMIAARCAEADRALRNRRDVKALCKLWYRDVVAAPRRELAALGCWPIDIDKAAAVVDPTLCRFRREALTVGI